MQNTSTAYPPDHSLWQDVNFTPDWLYQSLQKQEEARRRRLGQPSLVPLQPRHTGTTATAHSRVGIEQWSKDQDLVLYYFNSALFQEDHLSPADVAQALGRSVSSLKSRWMRLTAAGSGNTAPQQDQAKWAQEGRKVALTKFEIRLKQQPG